MKEYKIKFLLLISITIFSFDFFIALAKEESKLKLIVNQSINGFKNLVVLDKNKFASLYFSTEIWDLKSKKIIKRIPRISHFINEHGIPGIDDGQSTIEEYWEKCKATYNLQNGSNISCEEPINVFEFDHILRMPKTDETLDYKINNFNINNKILKEYNITNKLTDKDLQINRKYENRIKLLDINNSKKIKNIWGDQVFVNKDKYFVFKDYTLGIYSLFNQKLLKKIKLNNKIDSILEYKDKLIIGSSNGLEIWDYRNTKFLYKLNGPREPETLFIAKDNKIVANYIIPDYFKNHYHSNNKYFTKIYDLNNGKLIKNIEIKSDGEYFGPSAMTINNNQLVARMGPGRNWIDIWDLKTGKINKIIIPLEDMTAFNVNEEMLITGSRYGNIEIFNLKTGKWIKKIEGSNSEVTHVLISNGKLISASDDKLIKLWALKTGKLLATLAGHKSQINSLSIEKNLLLSSDQSRKIKIWNVNNGSLLKNIITQSNVKINLSGNILSLTGLEEKIEFVNTKTDKVIKSLKDYEYPITAVTKDQNNIYTGNKQGVIHIWDYKQTKIINTIKVFNNNEVSFLLVNDDHLAYANKEGKLGIINLKNNQILKQYSYNAFISGLYLYDNKLFSEFNINYSDYSVSDSLLTVIDFNTGNMINEFYDYLHSFTIFEKKLYYVAKDKTLKVRNLDTRKIEENIAKEINSNNYFYNFQTSRQQLITWFSNKDNYNSFNKGIAFNIVNLFDLTTGKQINTYENINSYLLNTVKKEDIKDIRTYIIGNKLYLAKMNQTKSIFLDVINITTGTLINSYNLGAEFSLERFYNENVIFLDDKLIIYNQTNTKIWDINNGRILKVLKNEKFFNSKIPNELLFSTKDYKILNIWDIKTLKLIKTFKDTDNLDIKNVVYDNSGKIIYEVNKNGSTFIKIFNLKTNILESTICSDYIRFLNQNYLIDRKDKDFNLYDLKNFKLIRKFRLNEESIRDFYISNEKLIINTYNGKIQIRDLLNGKLEREFTSSKIISLSEDNLNKLILQRDDNRLEIWDINKIKLLATYYSFQTATFVITPEGYFQGTGNYQDYLHFVQEENIITIDKFKAFERPDLVDKSLSGISMDAYPKLDYSF